MLDKQLFKVIKKQTIYDYHINDSLQSREANNFPFVCWPDESPCYLVNLYLLECLFRGLSRKNNGGTLRQYASQISQLVRFCHNNSITFTTMTDSYFTLFINTLRSQKLANNHSIRKKSDQSLVATVRVCLNFLFFASEYIRGSNILNTNGTGTIKAKHIKKTIVISSKIRTITVWDHHALSETSSTSNRTRSPISDLIIDKLLSSVINSNCSLNIIRRNETLIEVLECTGARIGEISELKIDDIRKALAMEHPMLRIITLKRENHERFIPISRVYLRKIHDYIRNHRQRIIRNKHISYDQGYLFISERTGEKVTAKYLSDLIGKIRRDAGFEEEACSHMFRHRFITKLFIAIIQQHQLNNEDEFRRALLDINSLKQHVIEWTGHKSLHSLDRYIHLAFEEYTQLDKTIDIVKERMHISAYNKSLSRLISKFENNIISLSEFIIERQQLDSMLD